MSKPRPLSALVGQSDYEALAESLAPGVDERVVNRRLAAGRSGMFDPSVLYLYTEVWGGTDENGYADPENPGLVGRLRIDPERDMTSRWVETDRLTPAHMDLVRLAATRIGGKDAETPRRVRAWSFRRDFRPMDYPTKPA
jgi:hypothetical protein